MRLEWLPVSTCVALAACALDSTGSSTAGDAAPSGGAGGGGGLEGGAGGTSGGGGTAGRNISGGWGGASSGGTGTSGGGGVHTGGVGTGGSSGVAGEGGSGAAGAGGTGVAGAGGSGAAGVGGNAASGGSGSPTTVEITATIADCVAVDDPNPDTCAGAYDTLHVDRYAVHLNDSEARVFLRFDLTGVQGSTILDVELVLYNVNQSERSGVVHQVDEFDRSDLFQWLPTPQGQLAADVGPVNNGTVTWSLPTTLSTTAPYCVSLSTDSDDGIGYATLANGPPPFLRVTYE